MTATVRVAMGIGGLVLLSGLLGGCAASQPARQYSYTSEEWNFGRQSGRRLTTDHYVIHTTLADDYLVDEFPALMERAFEYYQTLVPSGKRPDSRMPIYLFARRVEWEYFTRRLTGRRAPVFLKIRNGGYSHEGVTVIQYVAHQTTFPILAHEGLHQYLYHYVNPSVPAWLNEGLAVVCEGQRWTSSGLERFDASYNPGRRNQLAESYFKDRLFPLRTLLETNAGRVVNETSKTIATYYGQVWMLTQFLREGADGRYAEGFTRLLNALGSPELEQFARAAHIWSDRARPNLGEGLFRAFISEDIDQVEQEFRTYLASALTGQR